jgi:hypothetical protein
VGGANHYFRIDAHMTPSGHRLAAATIYDYLVKNRLLEGVNQKAGGENTPGR